MTARATHPGANIGLWPGLTIYRFDAPTDPEWQEIRGLSIGLVAQGSKAVSEKGRRHVYDQFSYLVINGDLQFQSEVIEASPIRPCLCMVLEVDPSTVREITDNMPRRQSAEAEAARELTDACVVSALDDEVLSSVLRFLRSLSSDVDRRVLAPLYLREVVYRVLQREQFERMLHFATQQAAGNPIGAALTYINSHWAEPITVATLAAQVGLSSSAFTRAFREVTASSPYQYVKDVRLNRARELVLDGRSTVAEVAHRVGYVNVSHFISEFRTRFGATPRDYAAGQSGD
ncbi:AraC family transcriptional regulator [Mycobacterium shigaense]|uniref:AraC family transcriptional regulator n=1 Tax=Mycobacterium shigaense TaxID=722731 RepID=UPI000E5967CB|nr:AraC family transcriptional regulator [Mycobacterium shigaense]MEA1124488.1 AraC family transcriptional regulator [Mycobacterium shigaense]